MVQTPIPIESISDPTQVRVKLLASNREVHAPMTAVASASIHGAAAKTTPVDADEFPLADSADSFTVKKVTWANIKAALKAYFDTLYQPLASALTSWAAITRASGFDTFVATPNSANLRSLLTDETGTGAAVFAGAPTITGVAVFSGIPSLTGGALSFPATQVASAGANNLDDYEEGTFTPVVTGSTSAGTGTYTAQQGLYTKIGDRVIIQITVTWTAHTGTGNLLITGLPFTAAADCAVALSNDALTYTSTPTAIVQGASTQIAILQSASNAARTNIAIEAAANLQLGGIYRV